MRRANPMGSRRRRSTWASTGRCGRGSWRSGSSSIIPAGITGFIRRWYGRARTWACLQVRRVTRRAEGAKAANRKATRDIRHPFIWPPRNACEGSGTMSQAGRDRQGPPAAHWGHQSITLYCSSSRTRWFCFDKRVLYHESVIGSYPQRVDTSPDPGMFDHMDRSYRSYIELGKLDGDGNEGVRKMQVLCKSSNEQPDTCCSVCGQGFVLFWERPTKTER